ncbi:MAG: hypothetical protein AAF637_20450, partial [Pseudomonadota bacterium]
DGFFDLGTDLGFSLPSIGGVEQIPVQLRFDSSFRPYDNQTGEVMVSFDDGATFSSLLTLDTETLGGNSVLDRANETVTLDVLVPSIADNVQFAWRLSDANNDWWWAIDNVEITADAGGVSLLIEDFDGLPLQNTVDEADPGRAVWTPTPPDGWTQQVADTMSQGATEFQGWTFMEKDFWIDTAENQSRDSFTLGTGNVAIADADEWDDANEGAAGDTDEFDSSLKTPLIDISAIGGGQGAGDVAGVLRVPALDGDEGLLLTPTASTGRLDTYSFIFDILLTETTQSFTALFQTDLTNSGDAEIYFHNDGETASIGISSDYDGGLEYGEWGRLALVFETDESGQQTLYKYLDGVFLDSQIVDTDVSDGSRWSIDGDAGLLLFAEPNGFTSETFTNALYFTEDALDADAIAALGGVDVDGPVGAATHTNDFQINFDGALDTPDYGSATLVPVSLEGPSDTSYLVKGSVYGNPQGAGEAALYQQSNGSDELLLWGGDGAEGWSNYTFDIVLEPADNDTVGAVFYYQDEDNFYRLTMNQQLDSRTLTRVAGGVEVVLATETASYRHFAMQDLRIAVLNGVVTITLDDEMLFDGPVTDPAPLSGGTIGLYTQSMDRALFDNISVNPITLAARALTPEPAGRWAVDLEGDGFATVPLSALASLSAQGIATYEWLVDGAVVATGQTPDVKLAPGETTLVLRVTDTGGAVSQDQITVHVAAHGSVLVADDFEDGDFAGWTVVDEGTISGPSDWQVVNGALVQASDIQSTQQGTGSAAYSTQGDGPYILRDGTYALWDDPDALDWSNYAFSATLTPNDFDGIGVLFRYTDPDNYYKLEADAQTGLVMLTRHLEGRETILARGYTAYTPGEPQDWRIEVEDGMIRTYIDGKAVFGTPVEDRHLPTGTVGLYGWASENLTFDDVTVVELGPDLPVDPGLEIALIDTETGARIATLEDGDTEVLASSLAGRNVTVAAFLAQDSAYFGQVESIGFDLNDGAVNRVDNDAPYALFRDIFQGRNGLLDGGENTVSIDLHSRGFGGGEVLDTVDRSFNVVDDIAPETGDLRVSLIDARTDEEIAEITDGGEIGLSQIEGRRLTIAAFVEDSFDFEVESMSMTLNDRFQRTDNVEPYSLFGDKASADPADYYGRSGALDQGQNSMVFELYSENWLFGDQLGSISFDFTVVDDLV